VVNTIVAAVVSGVLAGAILGGLLWVWEWSVRRSKTEVFKLELPSSLRIQRPGFKFGVIHARSDDGTLINRINRFKKDRAGRWHAEIRHSRDVGFQYKCFVDYGPSHDSDEVIKWLVAEGYEDPRVGGGKPNRVWFILPDKPTIADPAGFVNNSYYPE
jgi:hypothetical protein